MARMGRLVTQLEADDWERAALQAISDGGLAAVAVEPLARRLGVTKGSFYAHFSNRDELVVAALRRWEQLHVDSFAAVADRFPDPAKRLRALIELATSAAHGHGHTVISRLLLESDDARVRAAVRRITELRLAHLDATFRELGATRRTAGHRATIAYAPTSACCISPVRCPSGLPTSKHWSASSCRHSRTHDIRQNLRRRNPDTEAPLLRASC